MFDINFYKRKLADIEQRRNRIMRSGKLHLLPALDDDIARLRKTIEDAEPKPVTELFTPEELRESGLVPAVLEVHLAVDYLAACCYTVEDIVKKLGGVSVNVIPELKGIIENANKFCEFLYTKDDDLRAIIEDDETLMEAMHKKTLSYIKQRITKPAK